jgi:hypothetical protein
MLPQIKDGNARVFRVKNLLRRSARASRDKSALLIVAGRAVAFGNPCRLLSSGQYQVTPGPALQEETL